jgi:hypothetical protein
VDADNPYNLSDDARLSLLQARFESLHQGERELGPHHLVLGVIKSVSPGLRASLFRQPADFTALCVALKAGTAPAPLATDDVVYAVAAQEAIAGGIEAAAAQGADVAVEPLHLLLGVHRPCRLIERTPAPPLAVGQALERAGLGAARLQQLLQSSSD